jgi:predicted alpha-1,6-mannanase (GH76 family)
MGLYSARLRDMGNFRNLRAAMSILAAAGTMIGASAVVVVIGAAPANAQTIYPLRLCDKFCDGRDPALAAGNRIGATDVFRGRRVQLHFDDADNMTWASIDHGTRGDQVWLDRSFNGGYNWSPYGSKLGQTSIPRGRTGWRTLMYNLDQWSSSRPLEGVVRACGQTGGTISCTPWARTTWNAANNQRAAATALMGFYDIGNAGGVTSFGGTQLFGHYTVRQTSYSWWMSANDLTAIIDNIKIAHMGSYKPIIGWIYSANRPAGVAGDAVGDFKNDFVDDTGWWAMAWIDAYDLTGDSFYLTTAEDDANYMNSFWDSTCGGGVWWSTGRNYKNAIANELDLYVNAALHNRIHGDTKYLDEAVREWNWFSAPHRGLINGSNLVYDGLVRTSPNSATCTNARHTQTFTYNQGVVLEGLAELYKATGKAGYLASAEKLARASTTSAVLNRVSATAPRGELTEPITNPGDHNSPMFKGAYIRGLSILNSVIAKRTAAAGPYSCYLDRQSAVAYLHDRNPADQYGYSWAGPWSSTAQNGPDQPTSGQQGSALFLANAGPVFTSPADPAVARALHCTGG